MLRFSFLSSGSNANALFIIGGSTRILIDNGLSFRRLQQRITEIGETLDGLSAVFITHEHGDHVNGIGVLNRKMPVPIYLTEGTYRNLPKNIGTIHDAHLFEAGDLLRINDMEIQSYSISHDAADPVGYVIRYQNTQIGLAYDMGHVPTLVKQRLAGSHALILEANHCPNLLTKSSYPPALRQRISSKRGHLSNQKMSSLLSHLLHPALQVVLLVHLSEENNDHELALRMAQRAVGKHKAQIFVAQQDRPTPLFEIHS